MRLGSPPDFTVGTLRSSATASRLSVLVRLMKVRAVKRYAALILTVIRREHSDRGDCVKRRTVLNVVISDSPNPNLNFELTASACLISLFG